MLHNFIMFLIKLILNLKLNINKMINVYFYLRVLKKDEKGFFFIFFRIVFSKLTIYLIYLNFN
jgi:hypothetical protein